jgi:hypothetical protein
MFLSKGKEAKHIYMSHHQNSGQNIIIKIVFVYICLENVAKLKYLGTIVTN